MRLGDDIFTSWIPPSRVRSLLHVDHLAQDPCPAGALLLSLQGRQHPQIEQHLQQGGKAVVYESITRTDPEHREEHWIMLYTGEHPTPILSMHELCVQHGEGMLDQLDRLISEVALLMLTGHEVPAVRSLLLAQQESS